MKYNQVIVGSRLTIVNFEVKLRKSLWFENNTHIMSIIKIKEYL